MIIYKITNILDGKCYIGQSVNNFNTRYSGGKWWLLTNNSYLRNAVKKHGLINFKVEFLEENVESLEKLNELERIYAEKFNAYFPNGYNLVGCGDNRYMLQWQKNLLSEVQLKKKITLRKVDSWEIIEIEGLRKFARENKLNCSALRNMINKLNGTIVSQGFCLPERTREEIKQIEKKTWKNKSIELIRPNGTVVFYTEVLDAEKNEGVPPHSFVRLLSGNQDISYGYKLKNPIRNSSPKEWRAILISPHGKEVFLNGIEPFVKSIKPATNTLVKKLLLGEILEYKGWTLKELIAMGVPHNPNGSRGKN